MDSILDQADRLINSVGDNIDNNVESEQERQATLTDRLRIDMGSDNWWAKSIRPFQAAYYSLLYGALSLTALIKFGNDATIVMSIVVTTGGIVGTIIGFYFSSRKSEKNLAKTLASSEAIIERKLKASLEIERDKMKLEILKDKSLVKIQEQEARIEASEAKQKLHNQKRLNIINRKRAKQKNKKPLIFKKSSDQL